MPQCLIEPADCWQPASFTATLNKSMLRCVIISIIVNLLFSHKQRKSVKMRGVSKICQKQLFQNVFVRRIYLCDGQKWIFNQIPAKDCWSQFSFLQVCRTSTLTTISCLCSGCTSHEGHNMPFNYQHLKDQYYWSNSLLLLSEYHHLLASYDLCGPGDTYEKQQQ